MESTSQRLRVDVKRISLTLLFICLGFFAFNQVAQADGPDAHCASRADDCSFARASAVADGWLKYYSDPQNYPPSIQPYLVDVPAAPGDEFASLCVRWKNYGDDCFWISFYRARTFPPYPGDACYGRPTKCTRAMAAALARKAVDYHQQRMPQMGAYFKEYMEGDKVAGYCSQWSTPDGCYYLALFAEDEVDYEPALSQGPPSCQSPSLSCGNPINVGTGNKYQVETDWNDAGLPKFVRYYNSDRAGSANSDLGAFWTHTYSRSVVLKTVNGVSKVEIYRPTGGVEVFSLSGSQWVPNAGISSSLTAVVDSSGATIGWEYNSAKKVEVEKYDAFGRLTEILQRGGQRIRISYAFPGAEQLGKRISQVKNDEGRWLSFQYDISGMIAGISDSAGNGAAYAYDGSSFLGSVTRSAGSRRYEYNARDYTDGADLPGALTGIFDENGDRFATYFYDQKGRAVATQHAGGVNRFSVAYGDGGGSHVQTASGGSETRGFTSINGQKKVTTLAADCTNCVQQVETYSYDSAGNLDKVSRAGSYLYDYDYDSNGILVRKSEGSADSGAVLRSSSYEVDPNSGLPLAYTLTEQGKLVQRQEWSYNARGQTLTTAQIDPASGAARITTQRYCEDADVAAGVCPLAGLLLASIGPRKDVADSTNYSYYLSDDPGCGLVPAVCSYRKADLWKITDSLGRGTEYLAYDGAGHALSTKDANGVITDYTYNPRGWLSAVKIRGTDVSSEADDRITRIDYWPTGLAKQVTQPDGGFTSFTYDAAHRLTDITDSAGNTVHYTLDNVGKRIKEDTKDASGALRRTLSRIYNELSQLKTQATAAGDPTDLGYDAGGNANAVIDALGVATQNNFDPLNRLSRTLQDIAGIKAETKFEHDALDNLTKVTDPKGLDTKYEYNGFGDLVKLTSPDTGVTAYTYDSAGNRATQTDARGNTSAYSYDALNRITKISYPTSSLNVTYTYDAIQPVCASGETFGIGRLSKMQDGGAITQYCYNRFGDLVRKVQTSNGKALVLRYDYTIGGQLRGMTYPDATVVDYVRNAQGLTIELGVTPLGGSRQVLLSNASYYPFGPAANWTYGNGRMLERRYDLDYHPQAIQDTRPGGLEVGFGFDPAGNLTALTPAGNATLEIGLGYDALGRLTALKDGGTGTLIDGYTYDATGNRLTAKVGMATQAYIYPATSHRLSAVAGVARTYDAAGNATAIGGAARQYTYDTSGRMTQARRAGAVTMNYRYNGRGEQVRRFLGATNTYTLYDESGHWLGDYDTNGVARQQAIWLDDLPLGLLTDTKKLHYIEPDHLGSPRVVIDPARDVAVWNWSLKGEAFGNTAPNQDPDGDGAAFVFDMRFPGQRYDAASGLNQNYFRDYDAATGRYAQSDPIGLAGGMNSYAYVGSSPVQMTDPSGQIAVPMPIPLPGLPPQHPLVWAALGGAAIGAGFNAGYEYLSGGSSPGTDLYDLTHPQASVANDSASGVSDKAAQATERKEYSRVCKSPIPPSGDKCLDAKANLARLRQCLQLREAYSKKWFGDQDPGHMIEISNTRKAILNQEMDVRIYCKDEC
ncbi:RHS repeat-associated core domain-containing protein [Xanthomonas arboricola]|uniref:RHS repeat-associated core domain-containing protein n=2 Tax=Xanthomonas arboricola TaxID=56448 RepID=UPI00398BFCA1